MKIFVSYRIIENMKQQELSEKQVLRSFDVQKLTRLSCTTLLRSSRLEDFPTSIKLSTCYVGWWGTEIEQWLYNTEEEGD